ncbi:nuclear protein MDM1 isoform X2 [Centroberyx gerrardi]
MTGIIREPGFQRRRRFCSMRPAQTCGSLLRPEEPEQTDRTEPVPVRTAGSRSRSAQREQSSLDPEPPTPPGPRGEPGSPEPPGEPEKPCPSQPDSQSRPRSPLTVVDGQQPVANGVQRSLRWRAGLRSGGERSEYHRQFSWKKPPTAASPILTAQQVLHSSSRSVPPFKKNPVAMDTEYRRSFLGSAPPTGPRLQKHLEHQRVPLFHTHTSNRKRREEPERKPRPQQEAPSPQKEDVRSPSPQKATPPPPQAGHRRLTEYESSFLCPLFYRIQEGGGVTDVTTPQVQQLRQQALAHRLRSWGTNFSRDHLSQLQSEHNALWEPSDTDPPTDTDPPSPRLTSDLCTHPDGGSTSCVEALDLASRSSNSSKRTSVGGAGDTHTHHTHTNTHTHHIHTHPGPPAERRSAWGEEEEEETDEEGRLPTPRLKLRPVQRTHHDRTTPATGGAILVGGLRRTDSLSPYRAQRCGTAVSMAAGAETVDNLPLRQEGAWPENNPAHHSSSGPSPNHKPAPSPASKPIRMKQNPTVPPPLAPPPLAPPPPHCIQGTLRHPDFQHNGELGLRFRCPGGGCGSDEDDRLSVMSWRSAASCSVASAVLERAQKRRDEFWGKR